MIAQAFLAGGATLVAAFVLYRLWLGALPRTVCPDCGQPTAGVSHPIADHVERWMRRRWCAACGWTGWGRNGPVHWAKKGPVSHTSGFRWGQNRLERDFGFHWGGAPTTAERRRAPRPAHPSGFHWAGGELETTTASAQAPAHPSGFRFRDQPESEGAALRAHPSGFRWGQDALDAARAEAPAGRPDRPFRWADGEPTRGAPGRTSAFRWKS